MIEILKFTETYNDEIIINEQKEFYEEFKQSRLSQISLQLEELQRQREPLLHEHFVEQRIEQLRRQREEFEIVRLEQERRQREELEIVRFERERIERELHKREREHIERQQLDLVSLGHAQL